MIVDCAVYRNGHRTEDPVDFSDALDAARAAGDSFVWLGMYEPTEEEFDLVSDEFSLHPLAIEDAVSAHQRPKLETYQDSLFMVLKTIGYHEDGHAVSTGEVMIFLGDCFVVTVRHGTDSPLAKLRAELEKQPDVLKHGPSAVLHSVCDTVVDHYVDVAAELQTDLDELEASVFAPGRAAVGTAERIYDFKRQLVACRRATAPLQEPLLRLAGGSVPFIEEKALPYLRDVADHLAKANDQVESLDRLLSDILSANLAQVSVQQNNDMRKISAWAALVAVPTMIAGIYGMNFQHMPELRLIWGYPAAVAAMVLVCILLYRVFKRSGWL
ncbi:magnesium/cobalt transporter CorA [Kitasatospora atroaurantiaca]|uniref:Magnesium transport protein CorA n=1 Tax=Kitasatospora atroaurantiaca TaxID=285545 RepID=A0A561EYX6_9ACTN|nr:magnesium transporter [Kitasatospora atroaurantiaca]